MYPSKKEKNKRVFFWPVILAALILLYYSCSGGMDPHGHPEPVLETEQQLQINVMNVYREAVTGYDLTITGPTSLMRPDVGQSTFVFEDLVSGVYTVSVSKQGYLTAETEVEVELPGGEAVSHYDQVSLILQARTPPVSIDYREGGVIHTAPSAEDGIFGEMISISFAPGALPDGLDDGSGRVLISANRIVPSGIDETYEGTVQSYIRFDPEIAQFNAPVKI
jgi:hypothetical protein